MEILAAALAFDRAIRVGAAERVAAIPGGVVVLNDTIPNKWILNAVMLGTPLPHGFDARALIALADRHLAERAHRFVVVDDGPAAEPLVPALTDAGWNVQRVVLMGLRRSGAWPLWSDGARRIDHSELRAIQRASTLEERHRAHVETIVDGLAALRVGTRTIAFGAELDGRLSASATLYLDRPEGEGGIAMIDEVGTLLAARGRGLGNAVVRAAVAAALASGCDPIVIPADGDDWPRRWYERIGFAPLGTQLAFVRE